MSDTKTDQEIMDEFYATHSPNRVGANWRNSQMLDDDEVPDLDTVIEEFFGRIAGGEAQ